MTPLPSGVASLAAILLIPALLGACATGPTGSDAESASQTASKPFARDSNWSMRLPEIENVLYQGVVNPDAAGTRTGSMLYPAPHPAVFLAALITHGIINESVKSSQKTKLQEEADKVLLPYQAVLAGYRYNELMQQGLARISFGGGKKLIGYSEKSAADWLVESTPVFSMTQDQSAIILDNLVLIHAPGQQESAEYKKIVRVVSRPWNGQDPVSHWSAENGRKLKEASVRLFAESVDMALNDAMDRAKPNNLAHKTFRYLEGTNEKMERGQLMHEECDRVVIRTLRDAPMSIPVRSDGAAASGKCAQVSGY